MHITLPNADITLVAGSSATVRVVVVRNGYEGELTLRADGVPGGVTVDDVVVTGEETESALVFAATSNAAPGITDVNVRADADADSVPPSVRVLRLTIRPPGSFFLSVDPVSLTPGSSASTAITVNRLGGFPGTVNLSATAPAGLIPTLQPAELAGTATTSLLSIIADPAVRPGAYFIRITAASPGFPDETFDVVVSITGS